VSEIIALENRNVGKGRMEFGAEADLKVGQYIGRGRAGQSGDWRDKPNVQAALNTVVSHDRRSLKHDA
jgi:hypothetical protein